MFNELQTDVQVGTRLPTKFEPSGMLFFKETYHMVMLPNGMPMHITYCILYAIVCGMLPTMA